MSKPTLVLLHGFLGSANDWSTLIGQLPDCDCIAFDLPGHGHAHEQRLSRMADFPLWLNQQLQQRNISNYHLLGYSLGGRLALQFAATQPAGLQSLLLENAHPGLSSVEERKARATADASWARRFYREPLTEVLAAWYQQPVFADLSPIERTSLIAERSQNNAAQLAHMLCCCSLAKQADLQTWLQDTSLPVLYLCGEQDLKFQAIAAQLATHCTSVTQKILAGGHNLHRANPEFMAAAIRQWLTNVYPNHLKLQVGGK
ncbi:2-succinyl-6-hydroxy-2,4-cyclohexadiene-1-carboxylate synthase [uncultured Tolumonas sp.]|uniref:2-succinyl-6-hydroxy-2, 4-cyclohexadiene-1-carboxylate synthase n=1 Tax=uncultured Tolumonas sp. TaxID=263765 RepID=UPI00292EC27E|nr:2-succinyl-6-hydroxy-2,4-cyclohexadiene-1-carboxylate synthase [uncultured Tolumonas sp.]